MGLKGLDGIEMIRSAVLQLPRVMSQATRDAADELEDLIEKQFQLGLDPYGTEWAPLAESTIRRGRNPPPLTDEGLLRAAHVAPLQSAGIIVEFDEDYASFHQEGTDNMPARRLVPEPASFNQSAWYGAIVVGYSNAILKNGGWRAAGGDVDASVPDLAHAAE